DVVQARLVVHAELIEQSLFVEKESVEARPHVRDNPVAGRTRSNLDIERNITRLEQTESEMWHGAQHHRGRQLFGDMPVRARIVRGTCLPAVVDRSEKVEMG